MAVDTPTERPEDAPSNPPLPTRTKLVVGVLLAIPCIALALVWTYSAETPTLWGFPFFYWYQLLWVLITPILTYTAYVLIQRARGQRR
jgi:hypothetical protein